MTRNVLHWSCKVGEFVNSKTGRPIFHDKNMTADKWYNTLVQSISVSNGDTRNTPVRVLCGREVFDLLQRTSGCKPVLTGVSNDPQLTIGNLHIYLRLDLHDKILVGRKGAVQVHRLDEHPNELIKQPEPEPINKRPPTNIKYEVKLDDVALTKMYSMMMYQPSSK